VLVPTDSYAFLKESSENCGNIRMVLVVGSKGTLV